MTALRILKITQITLSTPFVQIWAWFINFCNFKSYSILKVPFTKRLITNVLNPGITWNSSQWIWNKINILSKDQNIFWGKCFCVILRRLTVDWDQREAVLIIANNCYKTTPKWNFLSKLWSMHTNCTSIWQNWDFISD